MINSDCRADARATAIVLERTRPEMALRDVGGQRRPAYGQGNISDIRDNAWSASESTHAGQPRGRGAGLASCNLARGSCGHHNPRTASPRHDCFANCATCGIAARSSWRRVGSLTATPARNGSSRGQEFMNRLNAFHGRSRQRQAAWMRRAIRTATGGSLIALASLAGAQETPAPVLAPPVGTTMVAQRPGS